MLIVIICFIAALQFSCCGFFEQRHVLSFVCAFSAVLMNSEVICPRCFGHYPTCMNLLGVMGLEKHKLARVASCGCISCSPPIHGLHHSSSRHHGRRRWRSLWSCRAHSHSFRLYDSRRCRRFRLLHSRSSFSRFRWRKTWSISPPIRSCRS